MKDLQSKQAHINQECGFQTSLPGLGLGLAAESGELVDYIAKLSQLKKSKPGDDMENLKDKIADEAADVLVYLLQIANMLDFDLEQAYLSKADELLRRHTATIKETCKNTL